MSEFIAYCGLNCETGLGKDNPEYTDFKYWKEQGWIDGVRPWK